MEAYSEATEREASLPEAEARDREPRHRPDLSLVEAEVEEVEVAQE